MLDIVFVAMFAVVPVLIYSVLLVKNRRKYLTHKRLQIALGTILLVAVAAFEIDMQLFTDWRQRALASPYYAPKAWSPVMTSLVVHLAFAIPTLVIWIWTIFRLPACRSMTASSDAFASSGGFPGAPTTAADFSS